MEARRMALARNMLISLLAHCAAALSFTGTRAPLRLATVRMTQGGPYEHLRTAGFDELLRAAPFFCDQLQRSPLNEEIGGGLRALLSSPDGARAFFTCWNADPDFQVADAVTPPAALLQALDDVCNAPGPTRFFAQTMLMNVAMATAAVCGSRRDGQSERVDVAMRSYKRAAILAGFISATPEAGGSAALPSALREESDAFADALKAEITGGAEGETDFNWSNAIEAGKFDEEQLEAILQAITLSSPDAEP